MYDAFCEEQYVYIALEFMENGNIFRLLRENELPESLIISIISQILSAVSFFHNLKIVHRDIKPENILWDKKLNFKLSDFGFSAGYTEKNGRKTMCGTTEYLAPEIIENRFQDDKVDIWCLGILLYELLHKKTPFNARNTFTLLNDIYSKKIEYAPGTRREFSEFINLCLEVDSKKRPSAQFLIDKFPIFNIQNKNKPEFANPTQKKTMDSSKLKFNQEQGNFKKHKLLVNDFKNESNFKDISARSTQDSVTLKRKNPAFEENEKNQPVIKENIKTKVPEITVYKNKNEIATKFVVNSKKESVIAKDKVFSSVFVISKEISSNQKFQSPQLKEIEVISSVSTPSKAISSTLNQFEFSSKTPKVISQLNNVYAISAKTENPQQIYSSFVDYQSVTKNQITPTKLDSRSIDKSSSTSALMYNGVQENKKRIQICIPDSRISKESLQSFSSNQPIKKITFENRTSYQNDTLLNQKVDISQKSIEKNGIGENLKNQMMSQLTMPIKAINGRDHQKPIKSVSSISLIPVVSKTITIEDRRGNSKDIGINQLTLTSNRLNNVIELKDTKTYDDGNQSTNYNSKSNGFSNKAFDFVQNNDSAKKSIESYSQTNNFVNIYSKKQYDLIIFKTMTENDSDVKFGSLSQEKSKKNELQFTRNVDYSKSFVTNDSLKNNSLYCGHETERKNIVKEFENTLSGDKIKQTQFSSNQKHSNEARIMKTIEMYTDQVIPISPKLDYFGANSRRMMEYESQREAKRHNQNYLLKEEYPKSRVWQSEHKNNASSHHLSYSSSREMEVRKNNNQSQENLRYRSKLGNMNEYGTNFKTFVHNLNQNTKG